MFPGCYGTGDRLQECIACGSTTGRCTEDSIYLGPIGPLCEDCYREAKKETDDEIERLRAEVERLRGVLREVLWGVTQDTLGIALYEEAHEACKTGD